MRRNQKHIIHVIYWKDNTLEVAKLIADSFDDAMHFIKLFGAKSIRVKIYDRLMQLVYTENIKACPKPHDHDYCEHGDYSEHGCKCCCKCCCKHK